MELKEKILITGGTGFIGSHLAERLIEQGRNNIRILALKNPIEEIENENKDLLEKKSAEIVYGDLRDKSSLEKALEGVDVVFHLGAISRPMNVKKEVYYDTNETGTKNLLEKLKDKPIKKIVHISTVSVLGLSPDGHPLKEDKFQEEKGDYGLSKRRGEKIALEYQKKYNLPLTVVRPCLIYGPRCLPRLVMFNFIKKGLFPILKGGKAKMEFCYVDNLIEAILLAEKNNYAIGETFNITDGQSYQIIDVINSISKSLSTKPPKLKLPVWFAKSLGVFSEIGSKIIGIYPPFSRTAADWMSRNINVYDCSKAKRILGYNPSISLDEGVRKTTNWYKEKNLI